MTAKDDREPYLYGVDLIRFICASLVVLVHMTHLTPSLHVGIGFVGVEVFFVISGMVIAQSANGRSPLQFINSRLLRLYPVALVCVVINVAALWFSGPLPEALEINAHLSLGRVVHSIVLLGTAFVGSAYWTLPIEIAFYGLIGVVLTVRRFDQMEKIAALLILWALPYAVLLVVQRVGVLPTPDRSYGPINMLLFRHGEYFALGMLMWLGRRRRLGLVGRGAVVLAVLEATVEIVDRAMEHAPPGQALGAQGFELAAGALLAWAVLTAGLMLSIAHAKAFPADARLRALVRTLGLMTFPLYLMHESVGGALSAVALRAGFAPIWGLALGVCTSLALAAFVVLIAEPPTRRAAASLLKILEKVVTTGSFLRKPGGVAA